MVLATQYPIPSSNLSPKFTAKSCG